MGHQISRLLMYVVAGLHPCVRKYLPKPEPQTLAEMLVFADKVAEILPKDDKEWTVDESRHQQIPIPSVTIENEYATDIETPISIPSPTQQSKPITCHKCGITGHLAKTCTNRRVKGLRPKRIRKCRKSKISPA